MRFGSPRERGSVKRISIPYLMKTRMIFFSAALLLAGALRGATPAQIEAWKKSFPAAGEPRAVQECAKDLRWLAGQVNGASGERTVRLLREKAAAQLAAANETLRSTKPPEPGRKSATSAMRAEAQEKKEWLENKLRPWLEKAPG